MTIIWLAISLVFLICAVLCHNIAAKKQLNKPLWTGLGAVFGPLAVLLIIVCK